MRGIAVVALLIATPVRADILDLSGNLGGAYSRSDSWTQDGAHRDVTTWDGDFTLSLSGSAMRPGLLDWLLSGEYRDQRTLYDDDGSRTRVIGGRGELSLLGGTPLPISLSASRTWSDFFTDLGAQRTGRSIVTALGASAVLELRRLPSLRATLNRSELDSHAASGVDTQGSSTRLTVGLSQALGNHAYALQYGTGWDEGTYAGNNYRSHTLLATYDGGTSDTALLHYSQRYYVRIPTVDDQRNPRLDDDSVAAGVKWRVGKAGSASFDYNYRHAILDALDDDDLEQFSHRVAQNLFLPLSKGATVTGNVAFGYGEERRADVERRSASQSTGASLSLRHVGKHVSLFAGADGSFGLVSPDDGELELSTSAGGSLGCTIGGTRAGGHASYSIAWRNGGSDLAGWSFQQRAELGAEALAGRRGHLQGSLALTAGRREDDILGMSSNRSATLTLTTIFPHTSLQLTGGIAESAANLAGEDPGFDDILFIPADYNARNRFATFTASRSLFDGSMNLTALARTLEVQAPDRPDQWEHAGGLTLSYGIGLLTLSIEDRVSVGGSEGAWRTANLVYVRLARSFGGRLL